MKSIQTELAEGQTASSSDFSWKGNRGGGRRRNAWRTQAKLLVKRLTLSKMRFHEPNSTTKAAKDIRFHATANSFSLFFSKFTRVITIWVAFYSDDLYWSLSWRLLSTKATTTQRREIAPAEEENNDKNLLLLSSSPTLTRLSSGVGIASPLLMKNEDKQTWHIYYSILCLTAAVSLALLSHCSKSANMLWKLATRKSTLIERGRERKSF